tara:strand:- start:1195 stop:2307 length:1113 start_codon:yes stop_codon:yes gene_type:complete
MSREQTITQYISTLLEKEGERGRFEKEAEKYKPKSGLMTNRNEPKKDEPVDTAPKVMSSSDHLFNAVEEMSRYVDDSGSDALTDSISRSVRIPNVPTSIDRRTPLVDLYRLNMGGETEQGFLKAPAAPVAPSIDTEGKGKLSFAQSMINSLRSRYQEKRINPNVKSLPEQDSITATELDGAAVGGASDGKVDEGLMTRPIDADAKRAISEVGELPDPDFDKDTADFIELNEGKETVPYKDSEGYWTVGIGHFIGTNLPDEYKDGDGNPRTLTEQEVQSLFDEDYADHKEEAAALPMYSRLDDKGKRALIDLTFNMGAGKFNEDKWPKFFTALKDEDLKEAAAQLKDSKWFKQTKNRAPRVIKLIKEASFN